MAAKEGLPPTMADVARLAGVSASTVSYVLSGARPISQATRERIQHAVAELGYTPNALARGLRGGRSKIIALLYPRHGRDLGPSSVEYLLGASDRAQDLGYHVLLWTTDAEAVDDVAHLAGQGLVDGVLVMQVRRHDARIAVLRRAGLAFAMIGCDEDPGDADFADTNVDQCARLAVDHLAGEGHRHLGFVNLSASTIHARRGNAIRLRDGILRAAARTGVAVTMLTCESSAAGGRGAFFELLARDPELTAVIASNERATPGIMGAAAAFGWRIPQDLSILAIDMPAQAALMTTPTMTTVGPRAAQMGAAAVDLLIRRLQDDFTGATQMLFDGELELRESSGPARPRRASAAIGVERLRPRLPRE
jgi:DNA-binding LacI/PurR family transcriptional regulator